MSETKSETYTSGKIDRFTHDELKASENTVGQLYPVLKNSDGEVIDGFHRTRVNPNWKAITLPVKSGIPTLKLRVHINLERREVQGSEKSKWIAEARDFLKLDGKKGTQKEIAECLGITQQWVAKYDSSPLQPNKHHESTTPLYFSYSVWGFKNDDWRSLIQRADPQQPNVDFYHGVTPSFIIENLIQLYHPRRVLDSMAGIGTTGWACNKFGIQHELFDLYPFPDYHVEEGDADDPPTKWDYDMIFNHLPYLDMVKYGDNPKDLSNLNVNDFYSKIGAIFKRNMKLLRENGVYVILVGDRRFERKIIPLTAEVTRIGLENGFILYDQAIKLTGESQSTSGLLQYRAQKFQFMVPVHDTILVFRDGKR